MSDQSATLQPTTLSDSPVAIGSQASADGRSLFNSPDGQTMNPLTPALVPVSRSARQARTKAKRTNATCGQPISGSPESVKLQSSLASRLKTRLTNTAGSIEYTLTWKDAATPAGRPYCLLRASARRTSDTVYFGWPTCNTDDRESKNHGRNLGAAVILAGWPTAAAENGDGGPMQNNPRQGFHFTLQTAAALSGWPTSRAEDSEQTGAHRGNPDALNSAAKTAGWATAKSSDGQGGRTTKTDGGGNAHLDIQARLTGWTPSSSRDWKDTPGMSETGMNPDGSQRNRTDQLPRQAQLCGYPTPQALSFQDSHQPGMNAGMAKTISFFVATPRLTERRVSGAYRLNPLFSLWLMGFPVSEWASCGERAMQSCRRPRRSSSSRTKKPDTKLKTQPISEDTDF